MTKVAVILSGCGYLDGAEIRESVLSLLYLDQHGAQVDIFAPDTEQAGVMDHLHQREADETRNVLVESARIARGQVRDLSELTPDAYDALVLPGGFGVAKNLSNFAQKGAECEVHPVFAQIVRGFFEQGKPIGAICIAPAVLAVCLRGKALRLTIGEDEGVAAAIEACGHTHERASAREAVIDDANKIATCSAYMREDPLSEIAQGIENVIQAVIRMVKENQ